MFAYVVFVFTAFFSYAQKLVLYLICVVWEVDLVEDLSCLVLYGLHLYLVRRVLTLPMPEYMNNKPVSNNNKKNAPDPDFFYFGAE
jgi:hypothetical protein